MYIFRSLGGGVNIVERGEFAVSKPPGEVLALLKKPEEVAKLIPGVSKISKLGDGYVAELLVKLGTLSGKLNTRFRYVERENGVVIVGNASGMQTTADFKLDVFLSPLESGTLVKWLFEGTARGLLSTLAPTLVVETLRKVALETARNLENYLQKI